MRTFTAGLPTVVVGNTIRSCMYRPYEYFISIMGLVFHSGETGGIHIRSKSNGTFHGTLERFDNTINS